VSVGIPVKPMLAKPMKSALEVLTRFDKISFTAEFKYDGERAQVHYRREGIPSNRVENSNEVDNILVTTTSSKSSSSVLPQVRVFSRNSEDMTEKYPDVADVICRAMRNAGDEFSHVYEFIIDAEVVAFIDGQIQPFQLLSTRARKNVVYNNNNGDDKVAAAAVDGDGDVPMMAPPAVAATVKRSSIASFFTAKPKVEKVV
jgi:DNA ligase 1